MATQLRVAGSVVLADFEDGGAATDGGTPDARIEALLLRDGERSQDNQVLRLAWPAGGQATFEVAVAPGGAARWPAAPALTFALAAVPGATPPSELVVELGSANGAVASWTLRAPGPLVSALPAYLVKARWISGLNGFPGAIRPEEVVLQTFTVPLAAFEGAALDPTDLVAVRFAFAGGGAGAVYLDEVALVGD